MVYEATIENAPFGLVGSQRSWSNSNPGRLFNSILATRVANPDLMINEVEKSGRAESTRGQAQTLADALVPLRKPLSAASWPRCAARGLRLWPALPAPDGDLHNRAPRTVRHGDEIRGLPPDRGDPCMSDPLLTVSGLKKSFDLLQPFLNRMLAGGARKFVHAVDGVDFAIERGTTLSLVGESGCGKSTVAKLLMGLTRPSGGSIRFDGTELAGMRAGDPPAVRRRMQMIFQDPFASLNPRWRVARIIAEPMKSFATHADPVARLREVDRLLEFVGLAAADGDKFPHEFSGGQRQRISIARAISTKPEFLVCDEPTSALDVSVQAQILNLMRELQRELGLTYLFISHDLAVVNYISDYIGVMYLGRLVELAPADQIFSNPQHPYTRLLLETVPDITMKHRDMDRPAGEVPNPITPPKGCHFHPRCPLANDRCRVEPPAFLSHGTAQVRCHAVEEGRVDAPPARKAG